MQDSYKDVNYTNFEKKLFQIMWSERFADGSRKWFI